MLTRKDIEAQLAHPLDAVDVPGIGSKYEGKVRECYTIGDKRIIIASDRLSAFDVVLTTIPFKGSMLTQLAQYWFKLTEHLCENHVLDHPHPNVIVTREVEILPVEVIVRGYITGSAWRDYQSGKDVSGISIPKGMKKSQSFDGPILTPSTKAEKGLHDEPISSEEILSSGLVEKKLWEEVCETATSLFKFGTEKAKERGLILVDTKYEFGILKDASGGQRLILADEIHTQDSSRYWMANSYQDRFENGEEPMMLDKEFVRGWLLERGYKGDGTPPEIPEDFRVDTSIRYMKAYEKITGQSFTGKVGSQKEAIIEIVKEFA